MYSYGIAKLCLEVAQHFKAKRGRPRTNPDYVPVMEDAVALDPMIASLQPKAAKLSINEIRLEQRKEKQLAKVQETATQREKNRMRELLIFCTKKQNQIQHFLEQEATNLKELEDCKAQIDQVVSAVKADIDVSDLEKLKPQLKKGVEKVLKKKVSQQIVRLLRKPYNL